MKTLLKVILVLVIIVAVVAIIGFFLPRDVHVERQTTIKADDYVVFDQVNNLRNWENWSPWHKIDTNMVITYDGESGEGASYSWTSENKNVGNGKLTIKTSQPYKFIDTEMDFGEMGISRASYSFVPSDSGVVVTWTFDTDMGKNPFVRYFGLMMDKMIGKDYEKGLQNLKEVSEKKSENMAYTFEFKDTDPVVYAYVPVSTTMDKISSDMGQAYNDLMGTLAMQNIQAQGVPFALYTVYNPPFVEFKAAIEVPGDYKPKNKVMKDSLYGGEIAIAHYTGPYDNLDLVYNALETWIKAQGKEVTGSPREFYINNPMNVDDSTQLMTDVVFPVK